MTASTSKLEVPREPEPAASSASTLRGEDDVIQEKETGANDDAGTVTEQEDILNEDEYPTGMKMFFIVLALVLSVFLFSLDLVSCGLPLTPTSLTP